MPHNNLILQMDRHSISMSNQTEAINTNDGVMYPIPNHQHHQFTSGYYGIELQCHKEN
ncbi:MAG: hypothetical protein MI922_13555 [Bacteroidales bacterium]|nr:hypothetical protein [Bacteroidales bacterium]